MNKKPCTVSMRKNATGEIREFHDEWYGSDFIWSEGNFACDCNRALFFARAKGEDEPEETPCGDDRYTILKIICEGVVVYHDEGDGDEQ